MAFVDRHPELSQAALLSRRATLGFNPDRVTYLAGLAWPDAVNAVVDGPADGEPAPATDQSDATISWWMRKITRADSGIHERMTFFWHTVLTTHRWASGDQKLLPTQLNLLRANALGNFRQLLQGFVIDGALIKYLNADTNTAKRPNENLARELMELFTVGIGHYSEEDVRAAALALTGWRVDGDNNYAVVFDPERAHAEPVTFMGETRNWDVGQIVDRLCDHPATAARISSLVWYHFIGTELDAAGRAELGAWWQAQNLEIKPLLARLLNDDAFRAEHYRRPRTGFEYYVALHAVTGFDASEQWRPRFLGQALYEPPNVGGWPTGDRWLNPDSMLRRSNMVFSFNYENQVPGALAATPEEILDRCGLYVVSDATVAALENAGAVQSSMGDKSVAQLRWRIALSSPEFQLT